MSRAQQVIAWLLALLIVAVLGLSAILLLRPSLSQTMVAVTPTQSPFVYATGPSDAELTITAIVADNAEREAFQTQRAASPTPQ